MIDGPLRRHPNSRAARCWTSSSVTTRARAGGLRLTSARFHDGDAAASIRILVSVEGDDARRLERIAQSRGTTPHELVAELLPDADRPAA